MKGKAYLATLEEQQAIDDYLGPEEAKGFIEKSTSPYGFGLFFVAKKDGTRRPVVNYKPLNKWTKLNKYPLPNMTELTRKLANAQLFTALDVRSGYNNIRMNPGDEWKAAFITPATRT